MTDSERRRWLWLACAAEHITAERLDRLLGWYGSAEGIWDAVAAGALAAEGSVQNALWEYHSESLLDDIQAQMAQSQTRLITRLDAAYPPLLREIPDPPNALFVRGAADLCFPRQVAIIGARRCTRYGAQMAERIARELAADGVQVVSGMARGIDTAANMGCVAAGGVSVAVLGCGADVVYPPENTRAIEQLLAAGGAVVSEYRPGTPPLPHRFPMRNRLISGLCAGLLVVEATAQSGAMITVRYALAQGREVFALPGPVNSPASEMPLQLIKEGAVLTTCGRDITEALKWPQHDWRQLSSAAAPESSGLSAPQIQLVDCLLEEAHTFEYLLTRTGFSAGELNSHLTMLEIHGIIRQLPGRTYELTRE